jgi:hypothetical protein
VKVRPPEGFDSLITGPETVPGKGTVTDQACLREDKAFNFIRLKSITNLKRLVIDLRWARAADPAAVAAGTAVFA